MATAEGVIKFYNESKGFGFIKRNGAGDIYLGKSSLQASGIETVKEGDRVRFDLVDVPGRQPKAENIQLLK